MEYIAVLLIILLVLLVLLVLASSHRHMEAQMSQGMYLGGGKDENMVCQEPWFSLIRYGKKTVEGRAAPAGRWKAGGILAIRPRPGSSDMVRARITKVPHYPDLDSYLRVEWKQAAPQCKSLEGARKAYLNIMMKDKRGKGTKQVFGEDRVRERGGIEAIHIEIL